MTRPYKVGMARHGLRYIEPDEIYPDLRRGASTRIPAQFPFTWNPVNGLGATEITTQNVLDDIINVGKGVVDDTKSSVEDHTSKEVDDLLKSGPGKLVLDAVQKKAAEGVTRVVKQQAPNLMMLAVAGGAVGGAISAKLGKAGTALAIGVALWSAFQLLNATVPPEPK